MGSPRGKRFRLLLDFPSLDKLLEGFDFLVSDGIIPDDVKIYRADGLDVARVPASHQYVIEKPGGGREREIRR
jgi:hypothetical protein